MRTWWLIFLGIFDLTVFGLAACGPIYPDQQPARQPAQDPAQGEGPPGGGADPWEASAPGAPGDPGAPGPGAAPDDPYGAPQPPPQQQPAKSEPKPKPSGLPPDAQALLDSHNRVRARHCAPPLSWSPKLAQFAQQWANSLRSQGCKFGHSGGSYGENLAAGSSGTLGGEAVTQMWYDEIKKYPFPNGGFSMETGHFTQVVWRESTQIGCAMTTCRAMDIWVCEYDPPGNVQGTYRQNVLPTGCK